MIKNLLKCILFPILIGVSCLTVTHVYSWSYDQQEKKQQHPAKSSPHLKLLLEGIAALSNLTAREQEELRKQIFQLNQIYGQEKQYRINYLSSFTSPDQ